jgi:hypothetical protein
MESFKIEHSKIIEFYISNNNLTELNDIIKCLALLKVLILDIFGNPF